MGSDLIGLTEVIAAGLMILGMLKPQAGVIGGAIAVVMFFVTSTHGDHNAGCLDECKRGELYELSWAVSI